MFGTNKNLLAKIHYKNFVGVILLTPLLFWTSTQRKTHFNGKKDMSKGSLYTPPSPYEQNLTFFQDLYNKCQRGFDLGKGNSLVLWVGGHKKEKVSS